MFIDTAICTLLLGSGLQDYLNYKFYEKSFKERRKYVTIGYMAKQYKTLAATEYSDFISNKVNFHKNYSKFTKREFVSPEDSYEKLEDFSSVANSKFELWKGRQIKRGVVFTEEQQQWLEEIKDYIVSNAYIDVNDIHEVMEDRGGIIKARQVFGQELQPILEDLSLALVG